MPSLQHKPSGAHRPGARFKPALERLEDRIVPSLADVDVLSATTTDSHSVTFQYRTESAQPFDVRVYRSADAHFSKSDDVALPNPANGALPNTFVIAPKSGGTHTATVAISLPLDAAHPYVFVVANPDAQVVGADDAAYFRTYIIGVVTHGFELTAGVPVWATQMAQSLQQGYDAAFAFDWSAESKLPVPGMAKLAASQLVQQIEVVADDLHLHSGDVIDLHLIGHSRGADVDTLALGMLATASHFAASKALAAGWDKLTWLDAHPARNFGPLGQGLSDVWSGSTPFSPTALFSYNPGSALSKVAMSAVLVAQAAFDDPLPVIPRNADEVEVIWQHNLAPALTTTGSNSFDPLANAWGYSTAVISALGLNPYGVPIHATDLTGVSTPTLGLISHYSVPLWYQQIVVPTLV